MAKPSEVKNKLPESALPEPVETGESLAARSAPIHWKVVLHALMIAAAGLWIYWTALQGDWLWDDNALVTDNPTLRSLHGLWAIWFTTPTTDYWPLSWTMLWMEWHLWENEPLGYHLCSLALHIFSGFLIWRLFGRLGLRWGWLGGLLFVIHPLAVESVAWVSEIKNTLSLPFFLLSLNAWLDAEEGKSASYRSSVLYYLAAMLAKTSTVMLPMVLLLYCWWKRGRVTWQELKRIIPYLAIAIILGLVTVHFQNDPVALGGIFTRSVGAGAAVFFYLGKFILPMDLLPIYPRWGLDPPSILQVLALPTLVAFLLALWTWRGEWGRHALFGFGFFLLNLLPVLGLLKMNYMVNSWVADHFVYLPMIGLVGLTVAGLEQLHERLPSPSRLFDIGTTATVILIGFLLWESHNYAALFNNSETLWTYTLKHNPQAPSAHTNLGVALMQTGRVSEAIEQFNQALKINQNDPVAHNGLGIALGQTGRVPEAIDQFEQALKIEPRDARIYHNLGIALMQAGHSAEAIEQFKQALKINPGEANTHRDLGIALMRTGHTSEAIDQFDQASKIAP